MAIHIVLEDWLSQESHVRSIVGETSNWSNIPLINVIPNHKLRDHQLVRFRGMVQHMFNPEFYLGQYEVENNASKVKHSRSGRYRDIIQCSHEEKIVENSNEAIEERQVFYCVTTPALNDWVCQEEKQIFGVQSICGDLASNIVSSGVKRQAEDGESMDVDDAGPSGGCESSTSANEQPGPGKKKISNHNSKGSMEGPSTCPYLSLNFPIEGAAGMACIVKTYESDSNPPLKLNDVVDVVGFLSLDPSLAHTSSNMTMDSDNLAENPPPSVVPRLHAVAMQKLIHINTLPTDVDAVCQSAENMRKELHLVLSQMLMGDTLAANYLICHLISLVYMRKDGLALGHFSMNLSNLPQRPDYTRLLYSILERILPKSHYLPMTLENMNTLSFTPKMDYEANRLSSGLLQLSDNTHLIVDETRLEAGKLDPAGVLNVKALSTLISHQIVNYDFQYYSKPYDADVPVLILSEGKSLLPCDVLVPLKVDESCLNTLPAIFQAANHFLREPLMNGIRSYICVMRHSSYEFPEDLQNKAQEDFVAMRQVGGQNVSADDLHLLLVLARLVSLSHGEKIVSVSSWEQAKNMEAERKERIRNSQDRPVRTSNEP